MSGIVFDPYSRKLLSITFNGIATIGAIAGLLCIYLGFRLFSVAVTPGTGSVTARIYHGMVDVGIKGPWPGVFFMVMGAVVIIVAMLSAGLGMASKPSNADATANARPRKARKKAITPKI